MRKFFNLKSFISFMLCVTVLFNSSFFRNDVKANAAVAVTYSAEAVAAIAGILASWGITVTAPDDVENIFNDYIDYTYPGVSSSDSLLFHEDFARFQRDWASAGFDVEGFIDDAGNAGSITFGIPDNRKADFTEIHNADGSITYKDLRTGDSVDISRIDNGSGGGSGGDDKTPLWKRIVAGFMAGATGLTSVGNSFYDYLHNSESVSYTPGFSGTADTFSNLQSIYSDFQYNYLASCYPASAGMAFRGDATDYGLPNSCSVYPYVDIYAGFASGRTYYDVDGNLGNAFFALVCYIDSTHYSVVYRSDYTCYETYPNDVGGTPSHFSNSYFWSNDGTSTSTIDDALNAPITWLMWQPKKSINEVCSKVGHYVNTDVATDAPADLEAKPQLEVAGKTYYITEGDNIYNNQQYITQQLADKTSSDGQVLIAAPQVDREAGTVTYPQYITYEGDEIVYGDTITYVNPDDVDVKEDVQLSDEDYTTKNIFQLLYNFCTNFFKKLRQTFDNILKTIFVPDLSGFYNSFDMLKSKFPVVQQVGILFNKLINYNFDSTGPPSFLIKYKTSALDYETSEHPLIDFSCITAYIPILHGIILFIAYYCFCRKVFLKLTKIFQP